MKIQECLGSPYLSEGTGWVCESLCDGRFVHPRIGAPWTFCSGSYVGVSIWRAVWITDVCGFVL